MLREVNGVLTYAILYSLSMVVFFLIALWLCHKYKIRLRVGVALGVCYVSSMNTGARFLYDILNSRFEILNYFDPAYYMKPGMWGGPLVYLAIATVGAILLVRDKKGTLDIMVMSLPVPMILAKIACFVNGCCYGAVSNIMWAVKFPAGGTERTAPPGVPLHPTQIYEILVLIIIIVVFLFLDKERWKGILMAWFIALYGFGRFLAEFFREPENLNRIIGTLTLSQLICFAAAFIASIALLAEWRYGTIASLIKRIES